MNREIKFRAWDNVNNVMELNIHYLDSLNEYLHKDKYDVMQYTGLKDKNGVDGYHKDIVVSGKKKFIIEWQYEEARFFLAPCADNTGWWQYMDMLKSFEIIGNVHQNPELI